MIVNYLTPAEFENELNSLIQRYETSELSEDDLITSLAKLVCTVLIGNGYQTGIEILAAFIKKELEKQYEESSKIDNDRMPEMWKRNDSI